MLDISSAQRSKLLIVAGARQSFHQFIHSFVVNRGVRFFSSLSQSSRPELCAFAEGLRYLSSALQALRAASRPVAKAARSAATVEEQTVVGLPVDLNDCSPPNRSTAIFVRVHRASTHQVDWQVCLDGWFGF